LELVPAGDNVLLGGNLTSSTKSPSEISIAALGSSFVLLAGIAQKPSRELVLLIWDVQYGVVLAKHTLSTPPFDNVQLSLSTNPSSPGQALLIVSPTSSAANGKKSSPNKNTPRTVLYAVPYSVPKQSTIANAMGKMKDTLPWLAKADTEVEEQSFSMTSEQRETLKKMRKAMDQNLPQKANEAYFDWEKQVWKSALR
jgi:hypothetical protein